MSVVLRHVSAAGDGAEQVEGLGDGDPGAADLPIFVLQPALPSAEESLHIFEPRYRLLLKDCLDRQGPAGQRGEFGMCWPVAPGAFSDVGTLLRVTSHTSMPDGRADVRCVGVRRFRVLARGMAGGVEASTRTHAEYNTAQIEWLEDDDGEEEPPEPEEPEPEEADGPPEGPRMQLVLLHDELLRSYPSPVAKVLLLKMHGVDAYNELAESLSAGRSTKVVIDAPADDAEFIWWCLGLVMSIVPLPQRVKAAIVSSRSAAKREVLASDVLVRVRRMLTEARGSGPIERTPDERAEVDEESEPEGEDDGEEEGEGS